MPGTSSSTLTAEVGRPRKPSERSPSDRETSLRILHGEILIASAFVQPASRLSIAGQGSSTPGCIPKDGMIPDFSGTVFGSKIRKYRSGLPVISDSEGPPRKYFVYQRLLLLGERWSRRCFQLITRPAAHPTTNPAKGS